MMKFIANLFQKPEKTPKTLDLTHMTLGELRLPVIEMQLQIRVSQENDIEARKYLYDMLEACQKYQFVKRLNGTMREHNCMDCGSVYKTNDPKQRFCSSHCLKSKYGITDEFTKRERGH